MPVFDQDQAHRDAGTHPGEGWHWWGNASKWERYDEMYGLQTVRKAFNADGMVDNKGSAIFETTEHRNRRLGK